MATSAVQLFELLAESTWERIRAGEELGCRQGGETITNINAGWETVLIKVTISFDTD